MEYLNNSLVLNICIGNILLVGYKNEEIIGVKFKVKTRETGFILFFIVVQLHHDYVTYVYVCMYLKRMVIHFEVSHIK